MTPFKHQHAESYRVDYKPKTSGGLVATKLVVKASISLESGTAGYSASKVDSLAAAATKYAESRGILDVVIESADTPA